jgi:hypothetical protein
MSSFRYTYLRDANRFPVACLAMQYDKETNTVLVGIATVHPSDMKGHYSKSLARRLAVGAAGINPIVIPMTVNSKSITTHDILWDTLEALEDNKHVPTRAKKAISEWFKKATVMHLADEANKAKVGESSVATSAKKSRLMMGYNPLIDYKPAPKKPEPTKPITYAALDYLQGDNIIPPLPPYSRSF